MEYLYTSVAGLPWSKPVLTQCYAVDRPWKLQKLYTASNSAWIQEQRQSDSNQKDNRNEIPLIHWESRRMYVVPRWKNSSAPHPHKHTYFNACSKHPIKIKC